MERVRESMRTAGAVLDMGTGGGERLAALAPFPTETLATEAYKPLDDGKFDLVINRHEKFIATELWRIMRPGGLFITQQVGERMDVELREWLEGRPVEPGPSSRLERSVYHLRNAGFDIVDTREAFPAGAFHDVGAIGYYLKAIPWSVRGFDVETHRCRLVSIHDHIQEHGRLVVTGHHYFIEARRR